MNSFGQLIRLSTFGESHGPAMGGVLDGMPPRVHIDRARIQTECDRRRPGSSPLVSQRREPDRVELLSGISRDGLTLGTPIGFIVRNADARSDDYDRVLRPNHADYTYLRKYGIHEFPGGGRASARETVSWVIAGAICRQWLETRGISVAAEFTETRSVAEAAADGDSVGGMVSGVIEGLPVGIGEPVSDKLQARLALAMMSINAAKAFEYGDGIAAASMRGSECADIPYVDNGRVAFRSNHSGGIQGGISNGMPVPFKVWFKPTPTIMRPLPALDADLGEVVTSPRGRHDPCVAIRAVPVVEAMALLTVADLLRISGL